MPSPHARSPSACWSTSSAPAPRRWSTASPPRRESLDVDVYRVLGVLHDELEALCRVLAHQLIDDLVRLQRVGDLDAQEAPRLGRQGRLPEDLRHHLAEALEARDV